MLKKILSWFNKNEPNKVIKKEVDKIDEYAVFNRPLKHIEHIDEFILPEDFNMDNNTCIILDDNIGQANVLANDILYLINENKIEAMNVLLITGNMCVFQLNNLLVKYGDKLNIIAGVVDLTLGGKYKIGNIIVKPTGIEAIHMLKQYNDDFKFIIYTGNNLNLYIEQNRKTTERFKNNIGGDIWDYIIIKGTIKVPDRRLAFQKQLFGKD